MDGSEGLRGAEWQRAWRTITWAGFLGGSYYLLCIAGAPRVKYLTELGATPFDFGVISALATFVIIFQVLGSILGNRVPRRKHLWFAVALAHRALFLGVLLAPLVSNDPRLRIGWILVVLFCHDAFAQTSVPIWFSWMADLVPKDSMSRHWATRQKSINAATIVVMLLIAFGFDYFETTNRVVLGFTIIGGLGVLLGVIDILMFITVPEPSHEQIHTVHWKILLQPIMDSGFRRFLVFLGYWHFAVFLAAPFFSLYLMEELNYSVRTVQLLGTAGALGVAVSSYFWGLVCDVYGYRPVLQILSVTKLVTPAAYLFAPRNPVVGFIFFSLVWFVDGIINSGLALAFQGPMLKSTPRRNRTMYIAAANFLAIGLMASISPVISGYIIKTVNNPGPRATWLGSINGYDIAFAMSLILLVPTYLFASRIIEPSAGPLRTVMRQVFTLKSLRATKWTQRLTDAKDTTTRVRAANILGDLRDPVGVGGLTSALHDSSPEVRDAAADALGMIGSSSATQALVDALFDTQSGIKSPAARALGRIGGIDSLRALLRYLHGRDSEALTDTVDSLARIGDDAAVLPLVCLFMEADDERLRMRVANALAKLTQADSLEEVIDLMHARRPNLQQIVR